MSINKSLLLIGFLIAAHKSSHAQYMTSPASGSTVTTAGVFSYLDIINHRETENPIEGTPYLHDNYKKGGVFLTIGQKIGLDMRYNIFNDRMEFINNDSIIAIHPTNAIDKVVIEDQTFVISNYLWKGNSFLSYFLRLDSGKVTLVSKMIVNFRDRQPEKPLERAEPAKYIRVPDELFIKIGDSPLVKIQNIKKLIEELPDHKSEMEEFAKKEKISANKPKQLTRFIQYYNSL